MFSKNRTFLVAALLASSAAAAPLAPSPAEFGVQAFINAVKAELKAQNVSNANVLVDKAEAHLKEVGFLNNETISELNDELKTMQFKYGISIDEVAEQFVDDLRAVDAIQKRDQPELGIAKDTLVVDPDLVKRVMARSPCPPMATHGTGFCCPS